MKDANIRAMFTLEDTHFWFAGKRAFITAALSDAGIHGRILDVGCGTGGTTRALAAFGPVLGMEINRVAANFARTRGLIVKNGSANKLLFPPSSFDLVTLCDVLYHSNVNEASALAQAYRVLAPGGSLLVTDCAHPWLWSKHDEAWNAKYRYTKSRLLALIQGAGFSVDRCMYIFSSIFPLVVLSRRIGNAGWSTPVAPGINRMLTILLTAEARLPAWIPRPWGSSLLILAHKP